MVAVLPQRPLVLVPVVMMLVGLTLAAPASSLGPSLSDLPRDVGSPRDVGAHPEWSWPLTPVPRVINAFNPPAQDWLAGHRGVDLAAAVGSPVTSPAPGRVVFTGWVVNRPVVTVDHGEGLLSSFEPVASDIGRGDLVTEGQSLGSVTAGGHCPAGCLHWGVRLNGTYVDPLDFVLDRRPSVLLPLREEDRPDSLSNGFLD